MRLFQSVLSSLRAFASADDKEETFLDAYLESFALMAIADGVLEENEKRKVEELLNEYSSNCSVQGSTPMELFTTYVDELLILWQTPSLFRERVNTICYKVSSLSPKRRAILSLMITSIANEGGIVPQERAILNRLKSALS